MRLFVLVIIALVLGGLGLLARRVGKPYRSLLNMLEALLRVGETVNLNIGVFHLENRA